jgi:conjugative transfer pilus assembly protein TraH
MLKKNAFKILTILTICIFCVSLTGEAGWLDNWYKDTVSTAPEYVKSQQRGYFTLGSFSSRVDTGSFYPISVSMPRLKAGCGGIDIFWGGVEFLGFDYLVQKLQQMIQAAPYVAFQIALKTISQKLGGILDTAEQLTDYLNSLQFNECQFLNGFMVKFFDTGDVTASLIEGAKKSGIYKSWKRATEDTTPNKVGNNTKANATIEGCPDDVKEILTKLGDQGLIGYIAQKTAEEAEQAGLTNADAYYNDPELIALIRGAVGDMYINYNSNLTVPQIVYVPPCGDAFSEILSKKQVKIRKTWDDNCTTYDLNQFFLQIRQDLYNLYYKMQNKNDTLRISDRDKAILDPRKAPLPIYMIIKTAIMTKDPALIDSIVEPLGFGYLRNAMAEVLSIGYAEVQRIFEIMSKEKIDPNNPNSMDPLKVCNIPQIQKEYARQLLENHHKAMQSMNYAFFTTLSQLDSLINVVSKYQNFYEVAAKQLASRFGVLPTSRVLSGI